MNEMKALVLLLLTYLFLNDLDCQVPIEDPYIIWSVERQLTWDDFKSDSAIQSPSKQKLKYPAAITCADVIAQIKRSNKEIKTVVIPYFDRNKSWKTEKLNYPERSLFLLSHEQIHFDIYEYTARCIRYNLDSLKNRKLCDEEEDYVVVIQKYLNLRDRLNRQFDLETSYGADIEAQNEWEEIISRYLEEYQQFSTDNYNYTMTELISILENE